MKKVLVTTSSFAVETPELIEQLESQGFQVVLNPFKRKLSEIEVSELIDENQPVGMIAGVEPLSRSVLAKAVGLQVISRCGIGMDSVDLEGAKEFGITVINTPDAPTVPVGELTLGLILALLRGIPTSDAGIRQGEWVRPMGRLLQNMTVGIIGCGRIGTRVAKYLSVFECKIIGYDPLPTVSSYFEFATLNDLLSLSDIVSLHLPYSVNTHHFLNRDRMHAMKNGAYLINAARGGLVDEQALYECLLAGHLAGIAFDCFEQEPYTGPLLNLKNVVVTGHIGSYAKEGRIIMERQAVDNLLSEMNRLGV